MILRNSFFSYVKTSLVFTILYLISNSVNSQDFDSGFRGEKGIRVMFYNCENLFDTSDDTLKNDEDFLPNGNYHWTNFRYWEKQQRIAKTISAVGGWEAPEIIGLVEIENDHVLINLTKNTSISGHKYSFVHYESPDRRGIDVALLYRPEKFWKVSSTVYPIEFPFDTASKTRDILYVKGVVLDRDTLHVFVNHFPSRLGGQFVTQPKREFVAKILKQKTDSILSIDSCAKILIMGDFNDNPTDPSILVHLGAKPIDSIQNFGLYNLMNSNENPIKTHFYRGPTGIEWSTLDQIIVSSPLTGNCIGLKSGIAHVFGAEFLFEQDKADNKIPKRTFIGMKYNDGFSDHLPVYVDLFFQDK